MRKIAFAVMVTAFILCACAAAPDTDPTSEGVWGAADENNADKSDDDLSSETDETVDVAGEKSMGTYTIRDCEFFRDGMKIYGKLYVPDGTGPFPAVILGHGFGANLYMMTGYADALARNGYIAYPFDFIGGGENVMSDGKLTEMSVLTEAADMSAVLTGIKTLPEVDKDNVILMGASQGGFVATYVAAMRADDIKGLIALYPAYVLQDDARKRTDNGAHIKDTFTVMDVTIGRKYDEDALSFDIYDVMKNYTKDALLIHGTQDSVVPYSYSERAVSVMPGSELIKIEGAGHVFFGDDDVYATKLVIDHLNALTGREH